MVKSPVQLQHISSQGNNTLQLGSVATGEAGVAANDPQSSHLAWMLSAGVQVNHVCGTSQCDMA
jgi:hypothetical protein